MTPIDWAHASPTALAAFLAAAVEFIEALTVVLAVGTVRGWRDTLTGSAAATVTLAVIVAVLGRALTHIPLTLLQLVVGVLLLLFGTRWLRKAIARSAGLVPMHDEAAIYARQQRVLQGAARTTGKFDTVAFLIAFKSVMLEGAEVVFIVIALSAGDRSLIWPASAGAIAALIVVVALGIGIHRPLARIPENTLKFVVGILLTAFGTFWVGEGFHLTWPGHDWAIPGLIAGYLIVTLMTVTLCRRPSSLLAQSKPTSTPSRSLSWWKAVPLRVYRLFVDDAGLSLAIVLWLIVAGWLLPYIPVAAAWRSVIVFAGLAVILPASLLTPSRRA